MAVTSDGGFVVSGVSDAPPEARLRPWVFRVDANGEFDSDCPLGIDTNVMERVALTEIGDTTTPVLDAAFVPEITAAEAIDSVPEVIPQCCWVRSSLPDEVSGRGAAEPLLFVDPVTIVWERGDANQSCAFNLYRGWILDLPGSYGDCLLADIPLATNEASDPEIPPLGECWFYLVTGENSVGEGPLGWDWFGGLRENSDPCP